MRVPCPAARITARGLRAILRRVYGLPSGLPRRPRSPGRSIPSYHGPMRILSMVLAGGEGKRLAPLTADRAKPAVPFGGNYRLIDFVLSNLVNAGLRRIVVLTQYKSHSLDRHIAQTWRLSPMLGAYVASVPAQMRLGPRWFSGSADAIFQNLNLISDEQPDHIVVFGADHVYRMDPRPMLEQHAHAGAGVTVAGLPVPRAEAGAFGIIETAEGTPADPAASGGAATITAFHEKPADPASLPGTGDHVVASMGNYVFSTAALIDALHRDAGDETSRHDIGGDIIPMLVAQGSACLYDYSGNATPGQTEWDRGYWRDVGELDSYYDAHSDLVSPHPRLNLYNREWPIYSWHPPLPPAKLVFDEDSRRGTAVNSMVSAGVIISGGTVRGSVLSPGVRVEEGAQVESSVLLDGVQVGHGATVSRAIIDKNVVVPPGARIGGDLERDRARFTVSQRGVVVIGKNEVIPEPG